METRITLGEITAEVVFKDIQNVHLSVYPPDGRVRIAAPARMKLDTLRVFALSKLAWIRQQQKQLREQARETPREYLEMESHYLWGERYLLAATEAEEPARIELHARRISLQVRPGTDEARRRALMEAWYREQLRSVVPTLLSHWEPILNVKVARVFVQRMKTRWGSCNPRNRTIRLNTELAKKPRETAEYIVVHEMAHLLEPSHNARFIALMDRFMPDWRLRRDRLNELPVKHEAWAD